jgi:hypothetical protein
MYPVHSLPLGFLKIHFVGGGGGNKNKTTGSLHVKSTHFRGNIFMTISDSDKILQACWVSL